MIGIEVTGTEQLMQKIQGLAEEVKRNILTEALMEAGRDMQSYLISDAPQSERGVSGEKIQSRNHPSGTLKRSIRLLKDKTNGNFPTVWAKPVKGQGDPDGWYAKFVEYGYSKHKNSLSSFGFIRRVYDRHESEMRQVVDAMIQSGIKKYMQG